MEQITQNWLIILLKYFSNASTSLHPLLLCPLHFKVTSIHGSITVVSFLFQSILVFLKFILYREMKTLFLKIQIWGILGWLSGWASAFSSDCDPRVLGSSPTSGSPQEACFSLCLSLPLSWINKIFKNKNTCIVSTLILWFSSLHFGYVRKLLGGWRTEIFGGLLLNGSGKIKANESACIW